MSPALWTLISVFVGAAVLRVPIAFSMLAAGVAYLAVNGSDVGQVAEQALNGLYSNFVLIAIPMFVFAANVMNAGTISDRLWSFSNAVVGRFRGGLGQVSVLIGLLFASMTGSAIADAAGPGLVTYRAMTKVGGYKPGFAISITAASATIAPVVPPSIPMILYAVIANVSVGAMFLAGIVPGLMMAASLMLVIAVMARVRNLPVGEAVGFGEAFRLFRRAFLPMLMPVIILVGIYSGAFTPTEAAVVAGLYAIVLSVFVYRAFGWRELAAIALESARSTGMIGLMIAGAFLINYAVTAEQVGEWFAALTDGAGFSALELFLVINLALLVAGCFLDTGTLMLVIVPLLLPAVHAHGIDPVHFGVVIVVNLMVGMITPPYGLLLFVLSGLSKAPLGEMFREIWPFVGALVVVLLLLVFFPVLVVGLPHYFGY